MFRPPPHSTLFPYTTLFRSLRGAGTVDVDVVVVDKPESRSWVQITLHDVPGPLAGLDRKSTRLNSSHLGISYAVFCLEKKNADRYCSSSARPGQRRDPRAYS